MLNEDKLNNFAPPEEDYQDFEEDYQPVLSFFCIKNFSSLNQIKLKVILIMKEVLLQKQQLVHQNNLWLM